MAMSLASETLLNAMAILPRSAASILIANESGLHDFDPRTGTLASIYDSTAFTSIAAFESAIVAGGQGGFLISRDSGASWEIVAVEPPTPLITSVAFVDGSTLLAGTFEDGVLRSDDGGASWEQSSAGLIDFQILDIATAKGSNFALLAAETGYYVTSSRGRSWRDVADLDAFAPAAVMSVTPDFEHLAIGSANGEIVTSFDRGASWLQVLHDHRGTDLIDLVFTSFSKLLAIVSDGLIDLETGSVHRQDEPIVATSRDRENLVLVTESGAIRTLSL